MLRLSAFLLFICPFCLNAGESIHKLKDQAEEKRLYELSVTYLAQGDPVKANEYANLALSLTTAGQQVIHPYDHWECLLQSIRCRKALYEKKLRGSQHIRNDIELIRASIREGRNIWQSCPTPEAQPRYAGKMVEMNELGIYFLTHFYKTTDAYFLDHLLFFAENNKARMLKEKITQAATDNLLPAGEQGRAAVITGQLCYFISLREQEANTSFRIDDSILYYQRAHEQFKQDILKRYPKIYALKYGQEPVLLKKIQADLKEDHCFLEYFHDEENYYCLAISGKKIIYKICGKKQLIDSLTDQYLSAVISKKNDLSISMRLYKMLIPSVSALHLIISPSSKIQFISFDALSPDEHPGHFLVYDHTVQYTFSAGTYFRHQPLAKSKSVLAFCPRFNNIAYPELNSQKENSVLRSFHNFEGVVPEDAEKGNFILKSSNAGIIHIASHLLVDTLFPLRSALIFRESKTGHHLSINEIRKLSINTQLITLAACRGNFGQPQNEEGMMNFAWAFHYAGAHNILSTHWDASDKSTSVIISDFYRNLQEGRSKQEALQLAKIHYLKNTDAVGAQPFFWANYSLYGDESPVDVLPGFLARFWWTPLLFLVLCYIALLTYKTILVKDHYEAL